MIGVYDNTNKYKKLKINFEFNLSETDDLPYLEGLYINWVDRSQKKEFGRQAFVIDHYLKKIPIVIYDEKMCITRKEFDWLKKFNVSFFEPALNYRSEFEYLPYWTDILSISDFNLLEDDIRGIDLFYNKNLKNRIKSFEKYYKSYSDNYPKSKVAYYNGDLSSAKIQEYKNSYMVEIKDVDWKYIRYTLVIDSYKNYNIGYLDPYIFEAMENGCVPLIPVEHRYFNTMFRGLEIYHYNDMNFFIDLLKTNTSKPMIDGIYENISKYYPEFTIEYASENIKKLLE